MSQTKIKGSDISNTTTLTVGNTNINGIMTLQGNLVLGNSSVAVGIQANGSYGSAGKVLGSNGSAVYWSDGASRVYKSTVASAGQNTFTTSNTFSSGNIDVYYNGVHLSTSDYSEIDTSTIKLNFNASSGDIIEISGYGLPAISSPLTLDMAVDNFTGTGSNTNFSISVQTTTNKSLVFINGVLQNPSNAYSIYGNVVSFTAAPSNNDLIEVRSPYFLTVNTTNITAVVGNNTVQFTNTAYLVSNNQTVNAITQTTIDSYDATLYRTAKYLVQIKDNNANNYQCDEIMVTHDGTSSYIFVFGEIATNTVIATFDSNLVSNNVSLLLTSTSSNTTTKVVRTMLTV